MKNLEYPWLYHGHYRDYHEDIPFWLGLANQSGGQLLELACGTGRVLAAFVRAGYMVYGLDRDAGMLEVLRNTLPRGASRSVFVFQGDMGSFQLHKQFPIILLTCNTLGTLSRRSRQATLDCVCRHLLPGGIFATSLPNPEILRNLPEEGDPEIEEVFNHPLSGNPVEVKCGWKRNERQITFHWNYDHLFPNGMVERVSIETSQDLASIEDYEMQLNQAGLSLECLFGDFNGDAYDPDSPNLILVAKRN